MAKTILSAKFSQDDRKNVERICQARGEDISSFLRRAVKLELRRLGCQLPDWKKKALGPPLSDAEPSAKGAVGC